VAVRGLDAGGQRMDVELGAFEVLEIAEKIERNGAKFYRRAAGLIGDPQLSTLLVNLAQWENRHIEVFKQMKKRLSAERWQEGEYAPTRVDLPDTRVMAGLAAFGIQPDPAAQLSGHETKADILRMAIEKEKDSIVYYTGLKDFIPHHADKDVIKNVIEEEMKHVRILVQSLEQLE
jgi:rubrerythrin